MDNKITWRRLKQLLSYDLFKLILLIVAGIVVWSLLFTMFGDALSEGQKLGVYSYNVTMYEKELEDLIKVDTQTNNEGDYKSYEIKESSFYNFGVFSANNSTISQQFAAWTSVGQLDVIFISSAKDLKEKTQNSAGEVEEISYALIELYYQYFYDLNKMVDDAIKYCKSRANFSDDGSYDKTKTENYFLSRKKGDNFYRHGLISAEHEAVRFEKIWESAKKMQYLLNDPTVDVWHTVEHEDKKYTLGIDMGKLALAGANTETGKSAVNLCSYTSVNAKEGEAISSNGVTLAIFDNTAYNPDLVFESLAFAVEVIERYSCLLEGYTA